MNSPQDLCQLKEAALTAYRGMELARSFEHKISALYKAGKIMGGVFLGRGHEAIAACQATFLTRGHDVYSPFIRENAGRFIWGDKPVDAARVYLGTKTSLTSGRDGNVHWGRPEVGNPAPISHLGAMVSVAAGMLLAKRFQGVTDCVGVTCAGDGTTSTGAFHEGCNMAAVEKLPLVVVVTNNQFAYSTRNDQQFACESLLERGQGYGMGTWECDGTDFLATLQTMHAAIEAARSGGGAQWVVANTLRQCGHGEHDDACYIPQELKDAYVDRDCLVVARQQLLELGWITEEEISEIQAACTEEVRRDVAQAQKEPAPRVQDEDWIATSWAQAQQ